ncbi:MAG: hypothetical protein RIQ81_623 [Pseudomonadota bacterium]|jgi:hypothetical protein
MSKDPGQKWKTSSLQELSDRRRQDHNRQLLEKMASGQPLWAFDSNASWFPPRPLVQKDPKAIEKLYGSAVSVDPRPVAPLKRVDDLGQESSRPESVSTPD